MHSFLWPSNISLCICTTTSLSIHLSMDIYVASMFYYCKQCCNERWDTCVFSILLSSGYLPRSGIPRSCGGFTSFFRNLHTLFHSGCINLRSHQVHRFQVYSSVTLSRFTLLGKRHHAHLQDFLPNEHLVSFQHWSTVSPPPSPWEPPLYSLR